MEASVVRAEGHSKDSIFVLLSVQRGKKEHSDEYILNIESTDPSFNQ